MTRVDETSSSREGPPSSGATSRSLLDRVKADDAVGLGGSSRALWSAGLSLAKAMGPLRARGSRRLPGRLRGPGQAHRAASRKQNTGDTFRGWLHRITDNKVRDHLRKLGREPGGEGGTEAQMRLASLPESLPPEGDDSIAEHEDVALLRAAVDLIRGEFEARTWQAFWLTAVEARSPAEVAAELDMTPGAVRVAKSRVLKRLREELGGL